MISLILALALAAAEGGATPPRPVAQAGAPDAKAVRDPNKVLCRWDESTGRRVRNRICMTRAQWDERDEATRRLFQDATDSGSRAGRESNPLNPQ